MSIEGMTRTYQRPAITVTLFRTPEGAWDLTLAAPEMTHRVFSYAQGEPEEKALEFLPIAIRGFYEAYKSMGRNCLCPYHS